MSAKQKPHTTPWRFCLSCCATVGCWALWLVLVFLLVLQAYIAVSKEVPVPDLLLRRVEKQLAQANLEVRFGNVHFDPGGRMLFENVTLRTLSFDEPLAIIRSVYIRKSFWSMLAGQTVPDEVRVEGATLQLPAIVSPSGTAEPLLQDIAATFQYRDDLWQVDQLTFRVANLPVTAHGSFAPPRVTGPARLSLEEIIIRFRKIGRQIALHLPKLRSCEQPILDVEFHPPTPGALQLDFHGAAAGARRPAGLPLEIGPFAASGSWVWNQVEPRALHAVVEADAVEYQDTFSTGNVRGEVVLFPGAEVFSFKRVQGSFAAGAVQALGEQFDRPVLTGTYSWSEQHARADLAFDTHGRILELAGTTDLKAKSAEVHLAGAVPPGLVTGLLTRYGPKLEPYFRFGDPVDLQARAKFDGGWKFAGLWTRVHGGRLDSRGVGITAARGRIDVDAEGNFLAHDALLVCGENFARGSYWMNFRSMNYRMLLAGQLRPPAISGWFRGDWWPDFWANFAFPTEPPRADVDVQGNWRNPSTTSYFGSTDAVNATVLGATFEKAHTRVFVRPQFAHAVELEVERAGGTQRGAGWFKRYADTETRKLSALEYDLAANLDADSYRHLGGVVAEKLLAPWRFTDMPDVQFRGRTDYRDDSNTSKLTFTGRTAKPAWFYGFPIDDLAVSGALNGPDLVLDKIDFSVVGGQAHAIATMTGTPAALDFDASVKNADLLRTIRAIETFEAERTHTKANPMADSKMLKRASGGKLNVNLAAKGSPDDLENLRGNGNLQLTGAELGEVHLFGLLSQVLSAVWLNFSSLKLDAARSNFQLHDGRMHFPDLKVTGPSAVIDAQGDYIFASKSLDFSARLKPYEETHNPLAQAAGLILNPLTSIFELKLTGPLAKPNWSVSLGGSSPSRGSQNLPVPPSSNLPVTTEQKGERK